MVEPKKFSLEGFDFVINAIPILKAAQIDKKIVSMVLPIIGDVESLDAEIKMDSILSGVSKSLEKMSDSEFTSFVLDLLKHVDWVMDKAKGLKIPIKENNLDDIFSGKLLMMYKLLFEVMKHNKFSPFVVVEGGLSQLSISSLLSQTQDEN